MIHPTLYTELDAIIKTAESKISEFHRARKEVDSYSRVIRALINKKVYQQCVDELRIVSQELNSILDSFTAFYDLNIEYFTAITREYLDSYKIYLECAAQASRERLHIQNAIMQIKVHKNSEYKARQVVDMMEKMEILQEDCLNKVRRVNEIANKIKENSKPDS